MSGFRKHTSIRTPNPAAAWKRYANYALRSFGPNAKGMRYVPLWKLQRQFVNVGKIKAILSKYSPDDPRYWEALGRIGESAMHADRKWAAHDYSRDGKKKDKDDEDREEEFDRQAYVTLQIDEQLKHETDPVKRAALESTKKKLHAEQSRSKQQEMAGKLASGWWGDHDKESRKTVDADLDEFFGSDWHGTGFQQADSQIIDQSDIVDGNGLRDERLPEGVIAPIGVLPDIPDDILQLLQQQAATQPAPLSVYDIASILWEHGVSASLSRSIHATLTEGTDLFEAVLCAKGSVEGALCFMLPQLNWLDDESTDLAGAARRLAERLGITDVAEDLDRLMDYFNFNRFLVCT